MWGCIADVDIEVPDLREEASQSKWLPDHQTQMTVYGICPDRRENYRERNQSCQASFCEKLHFSMVATRFFIEN